MFEAGFHINEQSLRLNGQGRMDDHTRYALEAVSLYRQAARQGMWSKLVGKVKHDSRQLADLAAVSARSTVRSRYFAGLQAVALNQIHGTEGRNEDFDRDFNPLKTHNRSRWMSVADAILRGCALPPVELIRVGEAYYVRDGHHRISVAKALGQLEIDAEVTVWELAEPAAVKSFERSFQPA